LSKKVYENYLINGLVNVKVTLTCDTHCLSKRNTLDFYHDFGKFRAILKIFHYYIPKEILYLSKFFPLT